jgi:hypothetical protein
MKLNVKKMPFLIRADDYHDFYEYQDVFQELNKNIKVKEIDCDFQYIGVVYTNEKSISQKVIDNLMKNFC